MECKSRPIMSADWRVERDTYRRIEAGCARRVGRVLYWGQIPSSVASFRARTGAVLNFRCCRACRLVPRAAASEKR